MSAQQDGSALELLPRNSSNYIRYTQLRNDTKRSPLKK